jgi:hypothetical protein
LQIEQNDGKCSADAGDCGTDRAAGGNASAGREADKSVTVTRILCENGQAVEYGQTLLVIE